MIEILNRMGIFKGGQSFTLKCFFLLIEQNCGGDIFMNDKTGENAVNPFMPVAAKNA